MASNQRASVSRLGSLRSSLASALEQHFPRQVRTIESRSGRRLSDLSDMEIVELLSGMLGDRSGLLRREVLAGIAQELADEGLQLPPDDPAAWPHLIRAAAADPRPDPKASPDGPADPPPLAVNTPPAPSPEPQQAGPATSTIPFASRPLFSARPDGSAPHPAVQEVAPASDNEAPAAEAGESAPSAAPPVQDSPAPAPDDGTASETLATHRPPAELFQPPLRPGVPEGSRPAPRSRRTRRMDAPATLPGYEPANGGADAGLLGHEARSALTAAALLPRPVFTSDLIPIGGSSEVVEAWEAECRAEPDASPVRFIAPKSRHRHRGRLVVPASASQSPSDWWSRCVDRYRAGRLYELAVVLRSVADAVTSVHLEDDAAVIRVSSPSGVGALVVLLTSDASEVSPDTLGRLLSPLMSERLTMIAILTASAERGSRDSLASAVRRLVAEQGWRPEAPLVAATSWEYADDPRSSAVFVGDVD